MILLCFTVGKIQFGGEISLVLIYGLKSFGLFLWLLCSVHQQAAQFYAGWHRKRANREMFRVH